MEAILAIDSKNGLAKDGNIPWKSKKDISFFINKTKNHIVVMGRKTYDSLPHPLKNRLNVVLTKTPQYSEHNNVLFIDNIQELQNEKIFIIGGKTIYDQFLPFCEKIWVTRFKKDYDCDLFFEFDFSNFSSKICEETEELIITEYFRSTDCRTNEKSIA
jgi:dihydrofolate reductase